MRMKRSAGVIAASTLALAGFGITGATTASADIINVSCQGPHQAELNGSGPKQCFKYTGSGSDWIYVDGLGTVCGYGGYYVDVVMQGGYEVKTYGCQGGEIYKFGIN
jgi:hypothetical protein